MTRGLAAVAAWALVHSGCSCEDTDSARATAGAAGAAGSSITASTGGAQPGAGAGASSSGVHPSPGGSDGTVTPPDDETGGGSASGASGPTAGAPAGGSGAAASGGSADVPGLGGSNTEPGGAAGVAGHVGATGMAGRAQGSAGAGPGGTGATGGAVPLPSGGTAGMGGSAGAAGLDTAGAGALGGAAGSSGLSCDPLCGAQGCGQTEPACVAEAFGLTAGDVIPICVPQGSALSYTYCGGTSCAETATQGCALSIHIGTVQWQLGPTMAGASSSVVLSATVTRIEGSISVTGGATCELTVEIPEATPLPAVADGAFEPVTAGQETLRLSFTRTDVDTSPATVTSDQAACNLLASSAFALAGRQIETALQEALNAKAESLTCLACRADCPQNVACMGQ